MSDTECKNNNNFLPWTVKYQARCFDDLIGHRESIKLLQSVLKAREKLLHHIIFCGPCGTGKSTLMQCCIDALLGNNERGKYLMQTNASEQRCLDNVLVDIQAFVRDRHLNTPAGLKKIVALDELDSMQPDAQVALQALMQTFEHNACFIMTCNDVEKNVVAQLSNKCLVLKMDKLCAEEMAVAILRIAHCENIECTQAGVKSLVRSADGDMRKMLNNFQAAHASNPKLLSEDSVNAINHAPSSAQVGKLLHSCCIVHNFGDAMQQINYLVHQVGFDISDIITTMYRLLVNEQPFRSMNDSARMQILGILQNTMTPAIKQQSTLSSLTRIVCEILMTTKNVSEGSGKKFGKINLKNE